MNHPKSASPDIQAETESQIQAQIQAQLQAPWEQQTFIRRVWRACINLRQWWFLLALSAFAWLLWTQVQHISYVPAQALSRSYLIGAPVQGSLSVLLVKQGIRVKKGQIVAQMNDYTQQVEYKMAQLEKKRLERQIVSSAIRFKLSQVALRARLQDFVSKAQSSLALERTRWKTSRAELGALNKELRWLKRVRKGQFGRPNNLGTLEARKEALQALISSMPKMMRLYRRKRSKARKLYRSAQRLSGKKKHQIKKILQPLQIKWAIQVLRIKKLSLQLRQLQLRAPVAGVIQKILQRPGARLLQGAAVLRLVQENHGELVAYINQGRARHVKLGMFVTASLRYPKQANVASWMATATALCAKVTGMGAIEPIPLRFRTMPQKPRWVRAVTIQLNTKQALIPGEMMLVRLQSGSCQP